MDGIETPRSAVPVYATLVELLELRARHDPARKAFTFLRADGAAGITLRTGELALRARRIAARLQREFRHGDRVLLAFAAGHEFVPAFFGCLYAGVVPVLAAPPTGTHDAARLQQLADHAGPVGLCTGSIGFNVRHLGQWLPSLHRRLRCLELGADTALPPAEHWADPGVQARDTAFVQFTSGTTGTPKAVPVSHANVVDNQRPIEQAFGTHARTRALSWLPAHQDMGLIGHVVHPLHLGIHSVLMPAAAFVASPVRWLQALSDHRATISGGPNYAFELCIRRVTGEQMRTLDLSRWAVAYNGSEMVRQDTMERFAEKFSSCGFRREAFVSCYGMAETTLLAGASARGRFPTVCPVPDGVLPAQRPPASPAGRRQPRSAVACGSVADGRLVVADLQTHEPCADGRIGEVWVRGAGVVSGYGGGAAGDAAAFDARLAGSDSNGWFRTGDLGFVRDGELFVTGSVHDVVEVRGRRYHPCDIEDAVRGSHQALREGDAAAFTVDTNGRSQLVVVQELPRREWGRLVHADIERAAQSAVRSRVGVRPRRVLLLPQGSLPKTPGGKLQRLAARDAYVNRAWPAPQPPAR